jgi:hypothetical protein
LNRLLALLALALALGCTKQDADDEEAPPPPKAGPPATAEAEPNDDAKAAQLLSSDARVKASLGPKDEDWYAYEAKAPTLLRLDVTGAAGRDLVLELFDAERNKLLKAAGPDAPGLSLPNVLCAGRCLVRVAAPKKDSTTSEYDFTLTASALTERSEREPNSRFVDAQPLKPGAAVDGFVATADDEDWYLLDTAALKNDQVAQVTLASPPGVRMELAVVRRSDQAPLATYRAAEPGQDVRLRNLAPPLDGEAGYALVVRSAWVSLGPKKATRYHDPKVPYTLEAKAAPGAPNLETEPNDDASHATVLELVGGKATRNAFLAPRGDVDWYFFHVDEPSIVRADVTGVDKVNLALAVIDPEKRFEEKGNEWARSDMGDVKEPEALAGVAVPAGDNYLRVDTPWKKVGDKLVRDYENGTDTYAITLGVSPDDGSWEREPNNAADKATPVEVGRTYQGFVQPARDVDAWRLTLAEPTTVAIVVSPVPKLDVVIVVKDRTGATIGTSDRTRIEAEERIVVPFEAGSFTIEVKDKATAANPLKPYSLTLK